MNLVKQALMRKIAEEQKKKDPLCLGIKGNLF